MDIICSILVTLSHFQSKADVKGHLVAEGEYNYAVDFSQEAKRKGYEGDYTLRIINKSECVKLELKTSQSK